MKTHNSPNQNTAAAVRDFADFIDRFEREILEAMTRIEVMLDAGAEQLDGIEQGTADELWRVLDQVGEARCAVADLRVNNLRRVLSALRPSPALAAAA